MSSETTLTAHDVASLLQGKVHGDGTVRLTGFAPADQARPGDLTFAENEAYLKRALASQASAVLVGAAHDGAEKVLIQVSNPRVAFAKVLPLFFPPPSFVPGIHPTAVVDPSAQIDPSAHVGPHCVVGEQCRIGPQCVLVSSVHVGSHCLLGAAVHLFPHVTLYHQTKIGNRVRIHAGTVVGADGFGYVFSEGAHLKVPQVGNVVIGDDVEIGANVTIDRGALGSTSIGKGTKIDNLVQIGHNVVVGDHSILVAQVGVSGSTRLGSFVTLAGQVGLAGHLQIGDRVTVGAKSGIMNNIPAGEVWMGIPGRESSQFKRQFVAVQKLPELIWKIRELEKRLADLEKERGTEA